ncbi:Rpn family recombination-promoting nuclease/putative transposase [uncultured Megamonas sp.]|uniref:Rpn family recombination-promoting nuclease/putative transposase n=1 Tax=uncultured Megamonas sp. TaxID=286140 RepID=UPI00259BE19F|nr:Rpn family recombination-promoting nuclease/putative transposase [uncultured Megamonas sp.]
MTTPAIKEAVEFEDIFLQDKIERRAYEQREKAIRDYYSYMSAFKENGLQQGIQQGLQKGRQEEKIKNAINFLKLGVDIETVARGVNLSINEVEQLKNKLNI